LTDRVDQRQDGSMMRTLCRMFAGGSTTIFGSRSRGATIVRILQAGIGSGDRSDILNGVGGFR